MQTRIVLVDDDSDFLEITTLLLTSEGFRVFPFVEPEQALNAIRGNPPDLVITDLMMGNLDSGFSLARAIKEDPATSSVPLLIVSGISSAQGYDFHPREAGDLKAMRAEAFLDKPVDPSVLISTVQRLIREGVKAKSNRDAQA